MPPTRTHTLFFFLGALIILGAVAGLFFWDKALVANGQPSADGSSVDVPGSADEAGGSLPIPGAWPALANPDIFAGVRTRLLEQGSQFVEADLSSMTLRVYDQGSVVLEVPIKTKGRPGSWWETPIGIYQVRSKQPTVFSDFSKVYMPWAMQFQGNFFIHGWPYYADGTDVATTYSGGCIRLDTEDAQQVYDILKVGSPVLVYNSSSTPDRFTYTHATSVPNIAAQSYLAVDLKNNYVFVEHNSNQVLPAASLTKLVTSLVAIDYINLEKPITVTPEMVVSTAVPRFQAGERYTIYDLLFPMLLESSNESAYAFGRYSGLKYFTNLMNDKAKALGMENTSFVEPAGTDLGDVSTSADLFRLAKYLYTNRSFILKLSTGKLKSTTYGPPAFDNLQNFNGFADDASFVGGVAGVSANVPAQTSMSIFNITVQGEERPVAIVVMGSQNGVRDAQRILGYIRENYH